MRRLLASLLVLAASLTALSQQQPDWAALAGDKVPELIQRAEKYLDYEWKTIPATAYLGFERTGDRNAMQDPEKANRAALINLMTGELVEGKGRFIDQILNGCWLATERTSWVLSAHLRRQTSGRSLPDSRDQIIDLGSARMGSVVSLCHYFFHEQFAKIDPSVNVAIEAAVKRNILDPFLDDSKDKANWWLGFTRTKSTDLVNNWNPWCNAEVMLCFRLMEQDGGRLEAAQVKSRRSLAEFTGYIKQDGACEEGPSYWGEGVGKYYDWLCLMDTEALQSPLFVRMVEYISRCNVGGGYTVNFADASARGGNDAELIWRCGKACGSKEVCDFALYCLWDGQKFRDPTVRSNDALRACMDIYHYRYMKAAADSLNAELAAHGAAKVLADLRADVPATSWYPETEFCFMRTKSDWFLGAKGGFNNESHNHNDVGSCVLYVRGIPVLCDAGVGTYTRQTFGAERYSIWTMQSDWHNLPMINSSSQIFGREFRSRNVVCKPDSGEFSLDIDGAYMEAANCLKWRRSYKLEEGCLKISDEGRLSKRVAPDLLNFLVKAQVLLPGDSFRGRKLEKGELILLCDEELVIRMEFNKGMSASVEEMQLEDKKLSKAWGPVLRRISLSNDKGLKPNYKIKLTEL